MLNDYSKKSAQPNCVALRNGRRSLRLLIEASTAWSNSYCAMSTLNGILRKPTRAPTAATAPILQR